MLIYPISQNPVYPVGRLPLSAPPFRPIDGAHYDRKRKNGEKNHRKPMDFLIYLYIEFYS